MKYNRIYENSNNVIIIQNWKNKKIQWRVKYWQITINNASTSIINS